MKAKVRILDIETGKFLVFISEKDAKNAKLHPGDLVKVETAKRTIYGDIGISKTINPGEIGVTKDVLRSYTFSEGEVVNLIPSGTPESVRYIRRKMNGQKLKKVEIEAIVKDIVDRKLRDIEISSFVTSLEINGLDMDEIAWLTTAMAETGDMLDIDRKPIMDVHSIGGVPGNKTNTLVVPIVAAAGLTIPKTSSRAIKAQLERLT